MADCQNAVSQIIRKMVVYYGACIKQFTCGMTQWVCQGTLYNPMVLKIMAHFLCQHLGVDPILGLSHTGISLHLFRDKPQGPTNFWMLPLWYMEYMDVS